MISLSQALLFGLKTANAAQANICSRWNYNNYMTFSDIIRKQ